MCTRLCLMLFFHLLALFYLNSVLINCRTAPDLQPFNWILCTRCSHNPSLLFNLKVVFSEAVRRLCDTSFSEELADRSTSWASKNSETDSDMESRLSLEACWVRGIPICSSACRQTCKYRRWLPLGERDNPELSRSKRIIKKQQWVWLCSIRDLSWRQAPVYF